MNIEDFARRMQPEEVLTPEELEEFRQAFYLSESWSKERILEKAEEWFMSDALKWRQILFLNERIEALETELAELRQAGAPPVDDPDRCQYCEKPIEQAKSGRKKKFCSEACKQKAKRERIQ